MSKLILKTLSPLHIGSGDEFEANFNFLYKDSLIYLFDEDKIVKFLISKNIQIPSNFDELKKLISKYSEELISSQSYFRKIETKFSKFSKPLQEQVSTQTKPIITGSSIKGAIKTAYLNKMVQDGKFDKEADDLEKLEEEYENSNDKRFIDKKKKDLIKSIDLKFINELKKPSIYLKISDSLNPLQTKVYKSINIKKEKSHQNSRTAKVEQISNFAECIKEFQTIETSIEISHELSNHFFKDLVKVCNDFYKKEFEKEFSSYFLDKQRFKKIELKANQFLLNIGKFGGAEQKSIELIRSLPRTGADVSWETSARNYALEKDIQDKTHFENSLVPFGWVLCEIVG